MWYKNGWPIAYSMVFFFHGILKTIFYPEHYFFITREFFINLCCNHHWGYDNLFHMSHDGETKMMGEQSDPFSLGFLLGILIGEGHFGGDGKQPQVTLRMHVRHEYVFLWLMKLVPGSKLYGPYHHGGRNYYQWICRGESLTRFLAPLIAKTTFKYLDPYSYARFEKMLEDYHISV
jgi:hypothetical protein